MSNNRLNALRNHCIISFDKEIENERFYHGSKYDEDAHIWTGRTR